MIKFEHMVRDGHGYLQEQLSERLLTKRYSFAVMADKNPYYYLTR